MQNRNFAYQSHALAGNLEHKWPINVSLKKKMFLEYYVNGSYFDRPLKLPELFRLS